MGRKGVLRNYDSDGNLISLECDTCHEIKAVSELYKNKSRKDGVDTTCKECRKEYSAKYRKQNAEYYAEYRKQNTDKIKEYSAEWRKQNKDKKKEYDKEWRKQNAEHCAEYNKQNADKRKERYDSKVEQSLTEIKAYVEKDPKKYNHNPNKEIYGIIYLVHNVKSDKYYVGQTINSFDIRYKSGWLYTHRYKDTVKTDLELYGDDSFEYIKIFKVAHTQRDLDKLEAYYIDYFNSYDNGYNETRGNIFTERK